MTNPLNNPFPTYGYNEDDEDDVQSQAEVDAFGDAFAETLDSEEEFTSEEFFLECPHGEKIERKPFFGFVNYVHKDTGEPCVYCNKFDLKSAKVSEVLAGNCTANSIREDAFRANLLTSPKRRKEYLDKISKLPMIEFLAEIKLIDRYIMLRHGIDQTQYKLGVEVFKAFGKDFGDVLDYLFPNDEYQPNSLYRRPKYHRNISQDAPKMPMTSLPEIQVMLQTRRDTEDLVRRAELGLQPGQMVVPNAPQIGAQPTGTVVAGGGTVGGVMPPSSASVKPFIPVVPIPAGNGVGNGIVPSSSGSAPVYTGSTPFGQLTSSMGHAKTDASGRTVTAIQDPATNRLIKPVDPGSQAITASPFFRPKPNIQNNP